MSSPDRGTTAAHRIRRARRPGCSLRAAPTRQADSLRQSVPDPAVVRATQKHSFISRYNTQNFDGSGRRLRRKTTQSGAGGPGADRAANRIRRQSRGPLLTGGRPKSPAPKIVSRAFFKRASDPSLQPEKARSERCEKSALFDDVPLPEIDKRRHQEQQRGQHRDSVKLRQRMYPNKRRISRRGERVLQFAQWEGEVPHQQPIAVRSL